MVEKKSIRRRYFVECKCPGCGRLWRKDMRAKTFKFESIFCDCDLGKQFEYTMISLCRKGG